MPSIKYSDGTVIISASQELLILPLDRPPEENVKRVLIPRTSENPELNDKTQHNGNTKQRAGITCASISKCDRYFAVCDDKKKLTIWECKNWNQPSRQWSLPTKAYAVCFSHDTKNILVADKSGDVLSFDLDSRTDTYTCLLGHLSMLLDICMSPCGNYIISSDRDEKIRVSRYPNAYNIHCYCLGHTDFVTSIQVVPKFQENLLLSASGDGSIRVWKYLDGVELAKTNVSEDIKMNCDNDKNSSNISVEIAGEEETFVDENSKHPSLFFVPSKYPSSTAVKHIRVQSISNNNAMIASIIDRFNGIILYTLNCDYKLNLTQKICCDAAIWDIQFVTKSLDIIFLENNSQHLQVLKAKGMYLEPNSIFSEECKDFFKDKEASIASLEILYKKLFDNVEQYTILKEKRLQQRPHAEDKSVELNIKRTASEDDIKRLKLEQNSS